MGPCIYIDHAFFNELHKVKKATADNFLATQEEKKINKIVDFLFSEGKTVVLKAAESLEDDKFELQRIYEDLWVQGKIKLEKPKPEEFEQELRGIGEKSPMSISFLSKPEEQTKNQIEESGYYCISGDSLNQFIQLQLIGKSTFEVAKDGDISNWRDFNKLSHIFNSILIFDSFLFVKKPKASRSAYLETIVEIVSNLLKANKCRKVNIVIAKPKLQPGVETSESLDDIQKKIEAGIKKRSPDKTISLGIVKIRNRTAINHDRFIFTNFSVFYSGDSFNYFQGKIKPTVETILNHRSILDWPEFQIYLRKLEKLKKVLPQIDKIGTEVCRVGRCDSPLLEFS